MKLPAFTVLNKAFTVQSYALLKERKKDGGAELDGHIDPSGQRVSLSKKMVAAKRRETYLHEMLHAIVYSTNIEALLPAGMEEHVVKALAPILLDTLRRNPKVLDFLLEVDK